MKTAIVFGANGYLGRNFAWFLKQQGYNAQLFGRQAASVDGYSNYRQLDILNKEQLATVDFNVDFVFVLTGLNGTTLGFEKYEEFILTNEVGMLNILTCIKNSKSNARVIFPSTRLVYDENNERTLHEDDKKKFNSIYALNKFFCENVLQIYANVFDIKYNTFRISVPYGNMVDSKYNYGTIAFFLKRALNKEDITIYGDGENKRIFTHIADILQIVFETITRPDTVNQTYNIGGEALSLKEVANEIAAQTGVSVKQVEWPEIDLKIEAGNTVFNSDKLDTLLKFKYRHTFKKWATEVLT